VLHVSPIQCFLMWPP